MAYCLLQTAELEERYKLALKDLLLGADDQKCKLKNTGGCLNVSCSLRFRAVWLTQTFVQDKGWSIEKVKDKTISFIMDP